MIEIDIGKLLGDATYLSTLKAASGDTPNPLDERAKDIYLSACSKIKQSLENLDLKASKRGLGRLIGNLQTGMTGESFKKWTDDFLLRLEDELQLTKFLCIETGKVDFYAPQRPLFGDAVARLYPTAYSEIEEAGKCLALGRSTACVFHLMRVLEVGIRAVANGLGIPDPTKPAERNWGFILKAIRTEIDGRKKWRGKGTKTFYEEAHASLDSVRNPWRNVTMHVEKTYTPEEAENILYAVRFFMTKIASLIDEDGKAAPVPGEPS